MPNRELGRARLVAQGLIAPTKTAPASVVAGFGAMQGQDLPGVIASIALRLSNRRAQDVVAAMNAGEVVRGYPMRGTVFAVAATDLAWLTQLCAARPLRAAAGRRGQLGLDADKIEAARSIAAEVLSTAPRGMTRNELFACWNQHGQPTDGGRGYHILTHLIASGEVCYGPWNGTDQNVVATADWLPAGSSLEERFNGDEVAATAELLDRYLSSHGPASLRDFAWWTKLPLRQVRAASQLLGSQLEPSEHDPTLLQRAGLADELAGLAGQDLGMVLLPGFDEFILGYEDRLFAMDEAAHQRLVPGNNGVFQRSVVVNGEVRALWKLAGKPGNRQLKIEEVGRGLAKTHQAKATRLFDDFPLVTR